MEAAVKFSTYWGLATQKNILFYIQNPFGFNMYSLSSTPSL
jgi:hypothetical protein